MFKTVSALILREMATTYGRSSLGYLWAILEPVGGILVMTLIFSMAFRSPPLGTNFAFFYATGYLPFMLYLDVSNKVAVAIRYSKPLLYYPTVTFFDAICARFLLNVFTQVFVACLVFAAFMLLFEIDTQIRLNFILLGIVSAALLGLGVGTLNCFLFSFLPAFERIWTVVNRPLFLISGIFFVFEGVPELFRNWLWFNPIIHVVGFTRAGFFQTYDAAYASLLYVCSLGLVLFFIGMTLLKRHHRTFINE